MSNIWIWLVAAASAVGGNPPLNIDGRIVSLDPPPLVRGRSIFVTPDAFATAVGRQAKVVVEGKLIVLCNAVSCAPVHLSGDDLRMSAGAAYVNLERLADALGYRVQPGDDAISLTPKSAVPTKQRGKLPAGSVLPDVVLTDLRGREVHLSDFLGRRVLLCTWASW